MPTRDDKPVKLVRKRLDADGVMAHCAELVARARQIEIRVKGDATSQSDGTAHSLLEVGHRLVAGQIVAVQVRFFDDDWWIDTIMRGPNGFRLVRMREGD